MNLSQKKQKLLNSVWSAAPTPFTSSGRIDFKSVERMVEHHVRLGVKGLFLCGSCGEGPWLTDSMREEVVRAAKTASRDRLLLAAQVPECPAVSHMQKTGRKVSTMWVETELTFNAALVEGLPHEYELLAYDEQTGRSTQIFRKVES